MDENLIRIQDELAQEIFSCLSQVRNWKVAEIHFEYFLWNEDYIKIHTATAKVRKCFIVYKTIDIRINIDAIYKLIELNKHMESEGEKWNFVDFTLFRNGKYKFSFNYEGIPPYTERKLRSLGEI